MNSSNETLFVATSDGVVSCRWTGEDWAVSGRGLAGKHTNSIATQQGVVMAGTRQGVYRFETGSQEAEGELEPWQPANSGLTDEIVRYLIAYPGVSSYYIAGTEPAGIYLSYDNGDNWRVCPEVSQMRDQYGWSLPYSPRAGAVRGFAVHGGRIYAAVEDGAVLVSDSSGESWRLADGSRGRVDHTPGDNAVHSDVHSIEVHTSSAYLVYAVTGGGLFRSDDGGATWQRLYRAYTRAIWLNPADSEHLILGPADGVDRNGRIEESRDGGQTWSLASQGLDTPWKESMVERFIQVDGQLLAVLSDGRLLASELEDFVWRQILPDIGWVHDAASMNFIVPTQNTI